MTGPGPVATEPAVGPLGAIYAQITEVADGLTEATMMLPSRCEGWTLGDVLYHELLDARRALVAFATPSADQPDTDAVSYWRFFVPDGDPADALDRAQHARHVRIVASAYAPEQLARSWRETSAAAVRAAAACRHPALSTQDLTLTTADFIDTLVVEAALHYLDMTVAIAAAPPPDPAALRMVRRVLEGLAGSSLPGSWDDQSCALKGTGRVQVSNSDQDQLAKLGVSLPLFG